MSTPRSADAFAQDFIDNLRAMATGSYLRDSDRQFWEPPYPESAVDDAQGIITALVAAARATDEAAPVDILHPEGAEEDPGAQEPASRASEMMVARVHPYLQRLKDLSEQHFDMLLDVEEIDELVTLVGALADANGAQAAVVGGHARAVCEG